ncbi:phosphoglycerate kinase [Halodesulfurarchaeum sp.]|uniref:phosphoglycerate kinase n=1 Tax=Halodesulfurarchaeum sp. TaxID=1980530 RepID=UPI001BB97DDD|nr:phosphoglycerate kinase [Halodesulfurarchaeum sp.]
MAIRTLDDLDFEGTSVGVRVDINSPLADDGSLADDARLKAHVDTLTELLERGARVTVLAHQGRPGGNEFEPLETHARRFDELLDAPVTYTDATSSAGAREAIDGLDPGQALLLENTRFYSEEYMEFEPKVAARTHLVERLSPHFDAFVNDAFAAAHRSQPSLVGFAHTLEAYAGRVMEREINVLGNINETPTPRAYVVGGAKVPDAIRIIRHGIEADLADEVYTAGLVANVFLMADGVDLGEAAADYIMEKDVWDQIDRAAALLETHGNQIHLPVDVAVTRGNTRTEVPIEALPTPSDGDVMDIGSETVEQYATYLDSMGTAILNGPAGVFENEAFQLGTKGLFEAVADTEYSVVGGGDTARAIRKFDITGFDHVSTGGGAALAMLTGQNLPAIDALDS